MLRRLAGARFQVLFHSPPGVLFTFPSRYLCAIGHRRVFRLGGWSPLLRTGFHVPGPTQGPPPGSIPGCAYGALTLCRRPSHAVRLPWMDPRRERQLPGGRPCNPGGGIGWRPPARRFGRRSPFARRYSGNLAVDFFSSGYLDVSVPRVVLPQGMRSQGGCQDYSWRVRPFGDPRVEGCVPLTADYRSLPRPSSASCAKASAVRPTYLPAHHPRGCRKLANGAPPSRGGAIMGVAYRRAPKGRQAVRCFSLLQLSLQRRRARPGDGGEYMIENRSDQMLNLDPCSLCGSQGTRVRAPGTGRCGLLAGRTGRTGFSIIRAAYSS